MQEHTHAEWRERAACRVEYPEIWFPIGEKGALVADQIRRAKVVCRRCPVTRECLDQALRRGEDDGIWGGLTPGERRELAAPVEFGVGA